MRRIVSREAAGRQWTFLVPAAVILSIVAVGVVTSEDTWRGYDITADWLVSRAFLDGHDVTRPISNLAVEYGVPRLTVEGVDLVHPRLPGAVLILSPLGLIPNSEVVVNGLLGFNTILTLVLIHRLIARFRLSPVEVVVGSVLVVGGGMVRGALLFGTWSILLAWVIDRIWTQEQQSDSVVQGGIELGVGMSLKLYPGAGLVALAFRRHWTAVTAGVVTVMAANALGLVFGSTPAWRYVDWLQAANRQWLPFAGNFSVPALFSALGMDPGSSLLVGLLLVTAGGLALIRTCTAAAENPWPLVIVGALLAQPVVWGHYWVAAVPVVAWIWSSSQIGEYRLLRRGLGTIWLAGWWLLPAIPLGAISSLTRQLAHITLGLAIAAAVALTYRQIAENPFSPALATPQVRSAEDPV